MGNGQSMEDRQCRQHCSARDASAECSWLIVLFGLCLTDLFNLKFTAKSLVRESKKCEQNAAANKLKCKKAMEVSSSSSRQRAQQRPSSVAC